MRILVAVGAIAMLALGAPERASAGVLVTIDKAAQRMTVAVDGATRHVFAVSTGRAGFGTPNGRFRPQRLARTWFSKKYYNSPMPHSIFFHGGYAIHGSYEIRQLGGPASHGCVRLHPANAAALFALVVSAGAGNTHIVVTGANPPPRRDISSWRAVPASGHPCRPLAGRLTGRRSRRSRSIAGRCIARPPAARFIRIRLPERCGPSAPAARCVSWRGDPKLRALAM